MINKGIGRSKFLLIILNAKLTFTDRGQNYMENSDLILSQIMLAPTILSPSINLFSLHQKLLLAQR